MVRKKTGRWGRGGKKEKKGGGEGGVGGERGGGGGVWGGGGCGGGGGGGDVMCKRKMNPTLMMAPKICSPTDHWWDPDNKMDR